MTPSQKLHKNDALWGAVAEALVAAYALMSAGGKLTSYRPFSDVDGKDIIIDLAGGFKDIYIQVKCTLSIERRIRGEVRLRGDHVLSSPKFVYIFCLLDRRNMELTRIWVVPSAVFTNERIGLSCQKESSSLISTIELEATPDGTSSR